MVEVLTNLIVAIICNICMYQIIRLYTLNLYKGICQLYLNKARGRETAMATHSSTLAWHSPWPEGPRRLQSMGSLRVGRDWVTSLSLFTFMHLRRKWQPTPVFLSGESTDGEAWWAAIYGVAQSQTRLKQLSSSSSSKAGGGGIINKKFPKPSY